MLFSNDPPYSLRLIVPRGRLYDKPSMQITTPNLFPCLLTGSFTVPSKSGKGFGRNIRKLDLYKTKETNMKNIWNMQWKPTICLLAGIVAISMMPILRAGAQE